MQYNTNTAETLLLLWLAAVAFALLSFRLLPFCKAGKEPRPH